MFDQDKNRDEFERLFDETSKSIFNLGLRLFRNREDAMDFAQDVYLQAYTKLDSFQGGSKFSTWLYSVAMNMGLNRIRKEKKMTVETIDEEFASTEAAAADELDLSDTSEIIQEELLKLEDHYRIPLILYYFEKMSYGEISEKLDIKAGTLKSNIHRGKTILRAKLIARGIHK